VPVCYKTLIVSIGRMPIMSDKKRIPSGKTDKPMTNSSLPLKASKSKEGVYAPATREAEGAAPESQLASFEAGSKLFHARKFREARERFLQAAEGPERDVAHRARLHAEMCSQRLEQPEVQCQTAEDHYNYGVALLNTRKVQEACAYLERALQLAPDSDHIHYALAVAHGLSGDASRSHLHLKRAIELEPKNRLMARQDADLGNVAAQPQFQALLYPEKKNW
jgi:tetratricopeptide (TPR) repeat protein